MKIKVHLHAMFKRYGKGKIDQDNHLCLSEHETLHGLSTYLEIPEKQGKVYIVNGALRPKEYCLHDGDEVTIFGLMGGG